MKDLLLKLFRMKKDKQRELREIDDILTVTVEQLIEENERLLKGGELNA